MVPSPNEVKYSFSVSMIRFANLIRRFAPQIAGLAAIACTVVFAAYPDQSEDIFMHLAVGRRFFAAGGWPDPDPWLFTLKSYHRGWQDVWGAHLGAYALYRLGGPFALGITKILLALAGVAAPMWVARRFAIRSVWVPLFALFAMWLGSDRIMERTSLIGDVMAAWTLALVGSELVRPSRTRWLLPILFVCWNNVHTSMMVGLFIVGAATVVRWRDWRRWLPLLACCLLAAFVHPLGPQNILFAMGGVAGKNFDLFRHNLREFSPLLGSALRGTLLSNAFVGACVLTAIVCFRSRRPPSVRMFALLVFVGLSHLAFQSVRFVTTAAFSMSVLVAILTCGDDATNDSRVVNFLKPAASLAMSCFVLFLLVNRGYSTPDHRHRNLGLGLDTDAYPYDAARFVASVPLRGHVFNQWAWGAFLAWMWDGTPQLFIHNYVLDTDFIEQDYLPAERSASDFDRVVRKYDVDLFFIRRKGPTDGLYSLLNRPGWHLIYWDELVLVFLRERPENRALIEKYELHWLRPFDRLREGMVQAPEQVLDEAARLLQVSPRHRIARAIVRDQFNRDPDVLRQERLQAR